MIKTVAELTGVNAAIGGLKNFHAHLYKTSALVRVTTIAMQKLWTGAKAMTGVLTRAGQLGMRAFASMQRGAIAMTVAVAGAIREFTVYNFQMARAWTMMDVGIGQFIKMRRQVAGMSGDLGVAKSQLASGLYNALSAGVPKDNVLDFLQIAGKAAVADMGDVSTAVDGLTTVMNAFKIPFQDAQKVADIMFTTVKNGKTTFGELASNLATVAPLAAANGIAFEQVSASIATLTQQGTPTAQAMTQIRAAIIGLNQNLGDGWAKTMTLQDAFAKMVQKAGGSQVKLKELMGSIEGVSAILSMTGQNAKMASQHLKATSDSADSTEEAFKKMDQMWHWPKLWQTVLGIVTRLGEVFDNVIKPVVLDITEKLKQWRDNDAIFDKMEAKLAAMREHAKNIWTALQGGSGAGQQLWEGFKDVIAGAFLWAAQKAAQILVKAAPIIGDLIGKAIKFGPERAAQFAAEWATAKKAGISTEEMHQMNLEAQGKQAAEQFNGARQTRIQRGIDKIKGVSAQGAEIRKERGDAVIAEETKTEQARRILQMRFDLEQREAVAARTKLRTASTSTQPVAPAAMNAYRNFAGRQQQDVDRVIAALEAVRKGDEEKTQAILAWAKKVSEKNKQLESQIKNLPL